MKDRWIINKAGLVNFWYYDEEEFAFANGRLLLRGSNGSGKSVTMQSFIPLLLDGNKSPERLDPFGSRARKLENYLLGEEAQADDERTGYIYMEFLKKETGKYLTIGLGLQARKGKPLNSWGFAITDGRRIGKDFFLYKKMEEKVPLSKIELKNRLADGGEFHEGQKDYMVMVNKFLYGFNNLDEYDELIKLLIQIRTPKLSKDFKPTVIYDIMNNALQPLSDEDLRPMSEAIENMDNIKSQLEVLQESRDMALKLKNEFDKYNNLILFQKTENFLNADKNLKEKKKELEEQIKAKENYKNSYQKADNNLVHLRSDLKMYEHKKEELEKHDSYRAKQEIEKKELELKELVKRKVKKQETLEGKEKRDRQLRTNLKDKKEEYESREKSLSELLEEMLEIAEDFNFHEHAFASDELSKRPPEDYDFSYLKNEFTRYRDKIAQGRKKLEEELNQKRQYDRALQELDEAKNERQEAGQELEKVQLLFVETKEDFTEKVYTWNKQNSLLKITEELMITITRLIQSYGQSSGYEDLIAEIRKESTKLESEILKEIASIESLRKQVKRKLTEKEEELLQWEQKKDPEPLRKEKVLLNREKLQKEGIPFIPLYKGIDFRDELDQTTRGVIEEALIDMGLLDALIIPEKYRKQVLKMDKGLADKYIFPKPQLMTRELSYLLKTEALDIKGISEGFIEQALKSIILNDQGSLSYIKEVGEYGLGVLKGKVSCEYEPKYIGSKAREKFRKQIIEGLKKEIEEIKTESEKYKITINKLKEKKEIINKEFAAFPSKDDLETGLKLLNEAQLTYENKQREVERREKTAEKSYSLLKQIAEEVRKITEKIYLPLDLKSYQTALEDAGEYKDMLAELETKHTLFLSNKGQLDSLKEQIEDIAYDIDNLLADLNRIEREEIENKEIIKNYQELLATTNYEEIKKEIDQCIEALKLIPKKIEKEIEKAASNRTNYKMSLEKLEELEEKIQRTEKVYQLQKMGFRQEYNLAYVLKIEDKEAILEIAKEVYKKLKTKEIDPSLADGTSLFNKYHDSKQYLAEYNLMAEYIFSEDIQDEDKLSQIKRGFRRLELSAKIKGKDVNFYTLVDFIEESIIENEQLLKESDRQLFEDILANTISKKIRARIFRAEQWVAKMNKLMESMNTSSGLSLSLKWRSKVAETEEQLDTRKLVDILKSDVSLLKEDDFKKLSTHFRSKIAEVRKQMDDQGTRRTFHAIMKDILDYRQWFEFSLFYKKTNENKRELTNNAFNKFSGGEKAMAMYVPLFSAVYARYEGGRMDCPRIISLDEAFAGVDANNIRDMFRLLEELKLNFVINSQVLWGDHDTVPSLSICELVRPNNSYVVSVLRYLWDGKVRNLIS